MKTLRIKKLASVENCPIQTVSKMLDEYCPSQSIGTINWRAFPYKPELNFRIAHSGDEIWLKYDVREKNILARETQTNGDVYKDSTVEFFVSLDGKNYYNFEFNCIGTRHLGYGPGRSNRSPVKPALVEKIEVVSSLGSQAFEEKKGDFRWEMTIRIPTECFAFDKLESFNNLEAAGNFYKCGDETSEPHFVSWNPIETENPDYHRPEFFGKISFD